ncbi:MAG: rod shape-determining protein MreC [Paracoccaceae bacterium]
MIIVIFCLLLFGLWRIDTPRVERLRMQAIDVVMPTYKAIFAPFGDLINLLDDFESYQTLAEQNKELRRELQRMRAWREAALQLEQENARLLDLNKVRLDPKMTVITGKVIADSGSPFRQSVLLNVGTRDGVQDGWPTRDGIGLVGRVSGVSGNTARVLLITDSSSRIPARIEPSGQAAIVSGDNSAAPRLEFIEVPSAARPGDRVVTSGDGKVFPPSLLIGHVAQDPRGRLRVIPAADISGLEFLRVLRALDLHPSPPDGDIVNAPIPDAATAAGIAQTPATQ